MEKSMEKASFQRSKLSTDRTGSTADPSKASVSSEDQISIARRQSLVLSDEKAFRESEIASAMKTILQNIGEDPEREGLRRTPYRFAKAIQFLTQGYNISPHTVVGDAIFNVEGSDLVIVRDIDIFSLCEHHFLPFSGKIHIGYASRDRVIGLSKLARIAEIYSQRLQVQERLTKQIAHAIDGLLKPDGVAVVVECSHMCMAMRGVQQTGATTVTECKTGRFRTDGELHRRFLESLGARR